MVNATLYDELNFNFIRDIAPVASISRETGFMVANPSVPAKTVPNFIAYARANPGKVNMASAGIGSPSHVAGELFKMMTGVNMVHVPYRGSPPALTDLLGGQVQVMSATMSSSIEHIRAGTLRVLAVITAKRSEDLPDLPTVGEFVPGYEASAVWGLGAPGNTPADIVNELNQEINACLTDPKMKAGAWLADGQASLFADLFRPTSDAAIRSPSARELLAVPAPAKEPETPEAVIDQPRVLSRPCPCCGGRMIVIETFARGCEPKHRPSPPPGEIRIDTS
jgi:hypothetical protein